VPHRSGLLDARGRAQILRQKNDRERSTPSPGESVGCG
jgi:hypothetical protein